MEINEIQTKKTIEKINETRSWFIENINKIDKPLARLTTKIKKQWAQINNVINEGEEVTTDIIDRKDHKRLLEKLYTNKLDNLEKMDTFLETHNLARLNHQDRLSELTN